MISKPGLKKKVFDPLNTELGRQLALLSDMQLLNKFKDLGNYDGTVQLLKHFWQHFKGAEISLIRAWIIKTILKVDAGECPWPSSFMPPK